MRLKLIAAAILGMGLASPPIASAQPAPTQAEVMAACASGGDCAAAIQAHVAALRAAGRDVDRELVALVTAMQGLQGVAAADVALAARVAAAAATSGTTRESLIQVSAAASANAGGLTRAGASPG